MYYYIIEDNYVGPNQGQANHVDADTIEIWTQPAHTNMSREERIYGWCGTTNNIATYAHGEYDTLDDAKTAVTDIFGDVREVELHPYSSYLRNQESHYEAYDDDIVAMYKPGKYEPMSEEGTADWIYESIQKDVTAKTSDEQILELAAEYEADANLEGYTLYGAEEMMEKHRQELVEEMEVES